LARSGSAVAAPSAWFAWLISPFGSRAPSAYWGRGWILRDAALRESVSQRGLNREVATAPERSILAPPAFSWSETERTLTEAFSEVGARPRFGSTTRLRGKDSNLDYLIQSNRAVFLRGAARALR
jgi:hypothetical protein